MFSSVPVNLLSLCPRDLYAVIWLAEFACHYVNKENLHILL